MFIIVGLSLSALKGKDTVLSEVNDELHLLWTTVSEQNSEIELANTEITKEKLKSDQLLLNILPHDIAEELKLKGTAEAKSIDSATILFTDFVGFTSISEKLSPHDLVAEINICFSAFDDIISKYKIEKIKTIGDSYMAASGVTSNNSAHAADIVFAAFEIVEFMNEHAKECAQNSKPHFDIRIGINSGPIIAGIVGKIKFQYDIWGDAVNIASRMESSGLPGLINVSETTYSLLKDEPLLTFENRGLIETKGKGSMNMYLVRQKSKVDMLV
jgi:adenylate cyclase